MRSCVQASHSYYAPSCVDFPSLKAQQLLRVLTRKPLRYRVVAQSGSHRKLRSEQYPDINFAWHDRATVPSGAVRKLLVDRIGLSEEEAHDIL
jgi:predicted RNA binding protein YcfA (HicA-like mRNA interferase family)